MKIALCVIAKNENNYIIEFVEHYKKLGVNTIFLYDNNDINGEKFDLILNTYVSNNFVKIIDIRGKTCYQLKAYNDCYEKNSKNYDWFMFFDVDEYLILEKHKTIEEFLIQKKFEKFSIIRVNWKMYNDNDLLDVVNDDFSLKNRFVKCSKLDNSYNHHVKTIVRGNLDNTKFLSNPHYINSKYIACNAIGERIENTSMRNEKIVLSDAWINHYNTKTIGEYVKFKMKRLYPDQTKEKAKEKLTLDYFFVFNKRTKEKEIYGKKLLLNK